MTTDAITTSPDPTRVIPTTLDSPVAKLVYFAVATEQASQPSELKHQLNLPLLTILGVLENLESRDHVHAAADGYTVTQAA